MSRAPSPPAKVFAVALPKASAKRPRRPLRTWQAEFGIWYAAQPVTPSLAEQRAAAEGFANAGRKPEQPRVVVTPKQLRVTKERADWQALVVEIEKGGIEAARAKFLSHLPELVDLHLWGARRSAEKDDTRGLVTYTVAGLDRVLPRTPEVVLAQQQHIVVALTPRQAESLDAPPIEVTSVRLGPTGEPLDEETPGEGA